MSRTHLGIALGAAVAGLLVALTRTGSPGGMEGGTGVAATQRRAEPDRVDDATSRGTAPALRESAAPNDSDASDLAAHAAERPRAGETIPCEVDLHSPLSDGQTAVVLGHRVLVTWNGDQRTIYFESGELFSRGAFVNGRREGTHEVWHKNGAVSAISTYESGRANGRFEYFDENGNPLRAGQYVDDVKQGQWTEYRAGGLIERQGEIVDGEYEGYWVFYDAETGELDVKRTGTYRNGDRVGP